MLIYFLRFKWDVKRFRPDFSISPEVGFITPGMDVTFEVTFHPKEIAQDIRYDVSSSHAFLVKNLDMFMELLINFDYMMIV